MRIVIQRVTRASVEVDGPVAGRPEGRVVVGSVGRGLMVLVGVENGDTADDAAWLAKKTASLRIFDDADGVMNLSVCAVGGRVLAISQFTLTASTRKGNRPSYIRASRGDDARGLYQRYCDILTGELRAATPPELVVRDESGAALPSVEQGIFGADMAVSLVNDGPVTIIIDSRLRE